MKITNPRVAHVDYAHPVTDVRPRPQFPEPLADGGQFVHQRLHTRVIRIAAGRFTQPAHRDVGSLVPIHIEVAGRRV